jgi:DNA-binding GntR family transcriptional regulator
MAAPRSLRYVGRMEQDHDNGVMANGMPPLRAAAKAGLPAGAGRVRKEAEPLSARTVDRLRDLIVTEELRPGTPLRERALAERLGVSRTPLRDALKTLAADGLVTLSPNRGAVVAPFSATAIAEKLEVLSTLEGFAGEKAAEEATDAEIAEVRALHHELLAAFERRDRAAYFHLNQAIHRALVLAARNATLADLHGQLAAPT